MKDKKSVGRPIKSVPANSPPKPQKEPVNQRLRSDWPIKEKI